MKAKDLAKILLMHPEEEVQVEENSFFHEILSVGPNYYQTQSAPMQRGESIDGLTIHIGKRLSFDNEPY